MYGLSDPAAEDSLCDTESMRRFVGVDLDSIPDESKILRFRHRLEKEGMRLEYGNQLGERNDNKKTNGKPGKPEWINEISYYGRANSAFFRDYLIRGSENGHCNSPIIGCSDCGAGFTAVRWQSADRDIG